MEWQIRERVLALGRRPLVMGIVNVTPDSFSDGGRYASVENATAHALHLVEDGADLLDIGGESTRPGADPVPLEEELCRVLPVVQALASQITVPISIDTSKAGVARRCLEAGAAIINDVTSLADPEMKGVVRDFQAGVILMHMQGVPKTMQMAPHYDSVMDDLMTFFRERLRLALSAGIPESCIVLDPGIGFGKTGQHNLEILARLEELSRLGRPICLGVSRKAFIGKILDRPSEDRLPGSLAAILYAQGRAAVHIVRVHDVRQTRDAVSLFAAIQEKAGGSSS
jgi:dihydropteroate synthase